VSVDKWDRRELCSDGACIGVIGSDGTCNLCGRAAPNWGEPRKRGLVVRTEELDAVDDDDGDEDDDDADEAFPDPITPSAPAVIGGGEWNRRQLCSDGACIGVIGNDGKCKVCGRPAKKAAVPVVIHKAPADDHGDHDHDDDDDDDDEDDDDPDDDEDHDHTGDGEHHDNDELVDEDGNGIDDRDEVDGHDDDEDDEDDDEEDEDEDAAADKVGAAHPTDAKRAIDAEQERQLEAAAGELAAVAVEEDLSVERKLCSDGACVGVIGPNGKCKICGKAPA
jgi:hypothetical protein